MPESDWKDAYWVMADATCKAAARRADYGYYIDALEAATEPDVRAAIEAAAAERGIADAGKERP